MPTLKAAASHHREASPTSRPASSYLSARRRAGRNRHRAIGINGIAKRRSSAKQLAVAYASADPSSVGIITRIAAYILYSSCRRGYCMLRISKSAHKPAARSGVRIVGAKCESYRNIIIAQRKCWKNIFRLPSAIELHGIRRHYSPGVIIIALRRRRGAAGRRSL